VHWYRLSTNPHAIHILEQNLDEVYRNKVIWSNPGIFEENYYLLK